MIYYSLRKTLPITFMRQISQSDSFDKISAYNIRNNQLYRKDRNSKKVIETIYFWKI